MIKFLPNRYIPNIPRWIELIIYSLPFIFIIYILFELNFWTIISIMPERENNNDKYFLCLLGFLMFIFYNIYQTSTIVDEIILDFSKQIIIINYSKYYIFKRKYEINFNKLSYKYYDNLGLSLSYISICFFLEKKRVIKLVSRNGWKKEIVDNIIDKLNEISPTKKSSIRFL